MKRRQAEDVSLRITSPEPLRDAPGRRDPLHGFSVSASAEGDESLGQRKTDPPCHLRVVAGVSCSPAHCLESSLRIRAATGAQESHDRVKVVESVDAVLACALPACCEFYEAVAYIDAFEAQSPESR